MKVGEGETIPESGIVCFFLSITPFYQHILRQASLKGGKLLLSAAASLRLAQGHVGLLLRPEATWAPGPQ